MSTIGANAVPAVRTVGGNSRGPMPWEGGAIEGWTMSHLLAARALEDSGSTALREKQKGVYRSFTWAEVHREAAAIALALIDEGLEVGDRVAIMGDARSEYLFAEMGVWLAGAISVGIYPTSAPIEVAYHLNDSGARFAIVEHQEHLDKMLKVRGEVPGLRQIYVMDTRATFLYGAELSQSYSALREAGLAAMEADEERVAALPDRRRPDDPLCLIYTSGTTGKPKGAVHSSATFLHSCESFLLPGFEGIRTTEQRMVAHLPLAHVVGKIAAIALPLVTRLVPHFPERPQLFTESIFEVAPTFVVQPPRFYEKYASQLLVSLETTSWGKRKTYEFAMRIARKVLDYRWRGQVVPAPLKTIYGLVHLICFVPLLRQIGYHRVRYAQTGSAPVPPEVATLWQCWGVDLRIVYGLTETGGLVTGQESSFPEPRDIGPCVDLPGYEAKVADDGELFIRAPSLFLGYWEKPEATAEAIQDGWLHTGDVVEVTESGHFRIIDRKKDLVITSGGKTLSPQQIENEVRASPYVSEAIVFAEGRKYVVALLELDELTLSEWAQHNSVPYTSYTDLVRNPRVLDLAAQAVEGANSRLSRVEQVKKFRVIPVELDPEAGDVTPTRKIKRKLIAEMFSDLIENMYAEEGADRG
jgi:long-chain acyl-CoA synthetase